MGKATRVVSKDKAAELQQRLLELQTIARKDIAERLERARELGDLSENAEYHDARDAQADIETEIADIEQLLREATIVEGGNTCGGVVSVGCKVVLTKSGSKSDLEYEIVGSAEADAAARKLSGESPLGQALIGAKEGQVVEFTTPTGAVKYKVKKIV